jgi:hypothetical protein
VHGDEVIGLYGNNSTLAGTFAESLVATRRASTTYALLRRRYASGCLTQQVQPAGGGAATVVHYRVAPTLSETPGVGAELIGPTGTVNQYYHLTWRGSVLALFFYRGFASEASISQLMKAAVANFQ